MLQKVKPWYSPDSIEKGSRWLSDLNSQLSQHSAGIICVTPESASAPWLLFEAGALSKFLDVPAVCPVVFGMEPTDLQGPLGQFQATRVNRDDLRRLVSDLNGRTAEPLKTPQLDSLFEALWPQLESKLSVIPAVPPDSSMPIERPARDILIEVLERTRSIERDIGAQKKELFPATPFTSKAAAEVSDVVARFREMQYRFSRARMTANQALAQLDDAMTNIPPSSDLWTEMNQRRKLLVDEIEQSGSQAAAAAFVLSEIADKLMQPAIRDGASA